MKMCLYFTEMGSPRERHSYKAEQVLDILLSDNEDSLSEASSDVSKRYCQLFSVMNETS